MNQFIPYYFADHVLARTTVFHPTDYRKGAQYFLNLPFFRSALYVASAGLYRVVENADFNYHNLSEKAKISVLKYINRACFRPIPFGLFSSVSLLKWGDPEGPADQQSKLRLIITPDERLRYIRGKADDVGQETLYETNPTIYCSGGEYRFLRSSLDAEIEKREYYLESADHSYVLEQLLLKCADTGSAQAFINRIIGLAGCTRRDATDYFDFLLDTQILLTAGRPAISGPPNAENIELCLDHAGIRKSDACSDLLEKLRSINADLNAVTGKSLSVEESLLQVTTVSERSGNILDKEIINMLDEGLYCLGQLCTARRPAALKKFMNDFNKHFEGETINLMKVLDPEYGIGYEGATDPASGPLLQTPGIVPKPNDASESIEWTPVKKLLLKKWNKLNTPGSVIELYPDEVNSLSSKTGATYGINVLFRKFGTKVFIENAGGVNTLSLIGRFTIADESISSVAKSLAHEQESADQGMIFAEILHLSDPHIDNINRRDHMWSYEIPITAPSKLPSEYQLRLNDLYVRIAGDRVVLWSEKHQKEVIPRLSTAYNHQMNKLPLFRFLADLSYQYGKTDLTLDLAIMFPGLDHYPRVQFQRAVLHLATWVFTGDELKKSQTTEDENANYQGLFQKYGIPQKFSLVEADQQLVFDRMVVADMALFADCVRNKSRITIKEFLFDAGDENDRYSVPAESSRQYNAFLLPKKGPVVSSPGNGHSLSERWQRKFMPGTEWLYLKIYTGRSSTNKLLRKLSPVLKHRFVQGRIVKWFFIRYEDPAPHIRLRLKIQPKAISDILISLKNTLEKDINQHLIREYQLDVYSRELERYAAEQYELVETHFYASSRLVISVINSRRTLQPYLFAMKTMQDMIDLFVASEEQSDFTRESYEQFLPEFEAADIRYQLDKQYRKLNTEIQQAFQNVDLYKHYGISVAVKHFIRSLAMLRDRLTHADPTYLRALLRSVIHMHLNRIFTFESRKQEMIMYFLLYKYRLTEQGRKKMQNARS